MTVFLWFALPTIDTETGSAQETTQSISSTTVTTLQQDFECFVSLRLYDPVEITRVEVQLVFFTNANCFSPIPGARVTRTIIPHSAVVIDQLPPGFRGPATILTCPGGFFHFECPPDLDEVNQRATIYEVRGPDGPLEDIPAFCAAELDCTRWPCLPAMGPYYADLCGDPDRNNAINATDALLTLRAAVSIVSCPLTQCDADRSGSVSATDALRVLVSAVGLQTELICPAPCTLGPATTTTLPGPLCFRQTDCAVYPHTPHCCRNHCSECYAHEHCTAGFHCDAFNCTCVPDQ
jgi:hypothetical protein